MVSRSDILKKGAADFMEVYWVWGIILQNLMEVGYDSSNMAMMSYDWRMSARNMEVSMRVRGIVYARVLAVACRCCPYAPVGAHR